MPGEARSRCPGSSLSHRLPTVRGVAHSWPAWSRTPLGGSGSRRDCSALSSGALLTRRIGVTVQEVHGMSGHDQLQRVVIGMDPHKRSVTIEVMTGDETVLGGGRYATDEAGFAAMGADVRQFPNRVWAI